MEEIIALEIQKEKNNVIWAPVQVIKKLFGNEGFNDDWGDNCVTLKQLPRVIKFLITLVNCKWSSYSEWSECSKSCGGGIRTSTRKIKQESLNGGTPCAGEASRNETCNLDVCPGTFKIIHLNNLLSNWYLKLKPSKRCYSRLCLVRIWKMVGMFKNLWWWRKSVKKNDQQRSNRWRERLRWW